ncbi:MAG: hypothetical protein CVV24_15500 [Ignavibacteriae bacterium HGW-Ignavibacteriae-3]|nr:MAG: hypothetical protein CVV24_15500 [Ignavibacteriae bacterium HGW-Ignavibacteriae-3]
MKKGCFLSFTVLFTLLVGAAVYVVKYKKDILKEFSNSKVLDLATNELNKKLDSVEASRYKDSLRNEFHKFFKRSDELPFDSAMLRVKSVISETQYLLKDKMIDSIDFKNFKKYLAGYERSKKN